MNTTQPVTEKRKSKSFWNRLLHLPRSKSQVRESKDEDSFRRQSTAYSSLHSSRKGATSDNSSTSGESENFTTIDGSALMDLHKDAGILFLNKESLVDCLVSREENRHVQFVPSPMNKYYKVDSQSAPHKKQGDENKENCTKAQPAKPILRLHKNQKPRLNSSVAEGINVQSNIRSRIIAVESTDRIPDTYPSFTRTSTKLALVDRKNVSLSQLNVSNIGRFNSLPRNQRVFQENKVLQKMPEPSQVNLTEALLSSQRNSNILPQKRANALIRNSNTHRQSCYGVSDPSRMYEVKKVLQSQHSISNHDFSQHYTLGGPMEHSLKVRSDSNHPRNESYNLANLNYFKSSESVLERERGSDQRNKQINYKPIPNLELNSNHLSKQHYLSTGQIPNKAINKVGLPTMRNENIQEFARGRLNTRSNSPHYIPLSETFSNKMSLNIERNPPKACLKTEHKHDAHHQSVPLNKGKQSISTYVEPTCTNKTCLCNATYVEQNHKKAANMSESRKKEIKSSMYSQKRKIFRKMCKYKSELCDEGFSSMADDECSFNCSCQTCALKQLRGNKRAGFKNFFSLNKNKYFFTIQPDIKEDNGMEEITESHTSVGNVAKAELHLSHKPGLEQVNKAWYNCNDSLCHTPDHYKPEKLTTAHFDVKKPSNDMVDNIYENITNIINSATKRNLKPQDVKRIFSTPLASPLKIEGTFKSSAKNPRALFPDDRQKTLDDSLKLIFTPTKNSDCLNDSIVLLQEIFQKLSIECKELLQPNVSSSTSGYQTSETQCTPTNRYVNDLVKNLKSSEISEADFALIIGGIAQNIFSETKAKQETKLKHSTSLPDLKNQQVDEAVSTYNSMKNLSLIGSENSFTLSTINFQLINKEKEDCIPSNESSGLPEGWSRTPTTEESSVPIPNQTSSSSENQDSPKYSKSDLQLLENTIRLGMGLSPIDKAKKAFTPSKTTKYKSRDVLSGKGKLKLKIYNNSGLVTVFVMKAAKLSWSTNRELNSYVKITMVPDELKRVHWRTSVQKAKIDPGYNQKFSFEVFPEDATKRLVFSVWHRDYVKQRSELIGCMSFSVRSVMDNNHNVDGWYRLLREKFGTQKHFAAHSYKNSCFTDQPTK